MKMKMVEFTFRGPEAKEVFLAGEFNNWDTRSLPMKKDKKGVWKMKIKLPPGRYEYKFFADNVWVESLPGAELSSNPFGSQNFIHRVK
jgi:1,4-alpha-glucan branching enzyme